MQTAMFALGTTLFVLSLFNSALSSSVVHQDLGSSESVEWTFVSQNESITGKATVPGGIFADLQNAGILKEHIFFRYNDANYRWVSKDNWTYSTAFKVSDELLQKEQINLIFNGINTVAKISLNGKELCGCKNMFTRFVFPVANLIKKDGSENTLVVEFKSSIGYSAEQYEMNPTGPGRAPSEFKGESHANMVRTMQASFGWDWGPALPSQGLWKNVFLEGFDTAVIRDITYHIEHFEKEKIWKIKLNVFVEQSPKSSAKFTLKADLFAKNGAVFKADKNIVPKKHDTEGDSKLEAIITVPHDAVDLWWPNGMNQSQPLYNISVKLSKDDQILSERINKIGFRTVKLVQEPVDPKAPEKGLTFYFEVNGEPIFAKGSNYIPAHVLPEKGTDPKVAEHLLRSSAEAGHNMLRVWGGGTYETDFFYSLCDELGIMIWQDFMFANALYPGTDDFNDEVRKEVTQNVRRLQYHPSIALWAGNNEIEGAVYKGWWGKTEQVQADYINLYGHLIRDIVLREDPLRPYVSSSPTNGLQTEKDGFIPKTISAWSLLYGDTHVYAYGSVDLMNSKEYKVARFVSEFGFQSLPFLRAWLKDTEEGDLDAGLQSEFVIFRQHQGGGNQRVFGQTAQLFIPNARKMEFEVNGEKFGDLIFLSQIAQAIGTKVEAEKHRRNRGFYNKSDGTGLTMGSMYWQLNDIWAAPSWGGIDHEGTWKMLHYFMAQVYAPVAINVDLDRLPSMKPRILQVFAINDLLADLLDLRVQVKIHSWQQIAPLGEKTIQVEKLSRLSAEAVLVGPLDDFLKTSFEGKFSTKEMFLTFQLLDKSDAPLTSLQFLPLQKFQDINYNDAPTLEIISVEKSDSSEGFPSRYFSVFNIKISTNKPAPYVWLDAGEIKGRFSDNGFIFTTEKMTIQFLAQLEDLTVDQLKESLTIQSLCDAMKPV